MGCYGENDAFRGKLVLEYRRNTGDIGREGIMGDETRKVV